MKLIKSLLIILCLISNINIALAKVDIPEYYTSKNLDYLNSLIKEPPKSDDKNTLFLKRKGIAFHQLAVMDVKDASENAVEHLDKYIKLQPNDYEALAFLGSSYSMLARDSFAIYKKINYVKKSLELLDEAVKNLPNNFLIRLIRANLAFHLPNIFERKSTAYEDYEYLATHFQNKSNYITEIYYKLGVLLKDAQKLDEAKRYFLLAANSNQSLDWAKKAKDELND